MVFSQPKVNNCQDRQLRLSWNRWINGACWQCGVYPKDPSDGIFRLKNMGRMGTCSPKSVSEMEPFFLGEGGGVAGGGGGDFKIKISLFGSFQKVEFCHEGEKFHPCGRSRSHKSRQKSGRRSSTTKTTTTNTMAPTPQPHPPPFLKVPSPLMTTTNTTAPPPQPPPPPFLKYHHH